MTRVIVGAMATMILIWSTWVAAQMARRAIIAAKTHQARPVVGWTAFRVFEPIRFWWYVVVRAWPILPCTAIAAASIAILVLQFRP